MPARCLPGALPRSSLSQVGGAGGYDWSKPTRPPGFGIWVADHRRGVRTFFLAVDVALVATIIASVVRGDVWWQLYLQAVLWPWLTYQAGWLVPSTVDRWRSYQGSPDADADSEARRTS